MRCRGPIVALAFAVLTSSMWRGIEATASADSPSPTASAAPPILKLDLPSEEPRQYVITPPPGQRCLETRGGAFEYTKGTTFAVRETNPEVARVEFTASPTGTGVQEGVSLGRGIRVSSDSGPVWEVVTQAGGLVSGRGISANEYDVEGKGISEVDIPGCEPLDAKTFDLYFPFLVRKVSERCYVFKKGLAEALAAAVIPEEFHRAIPPHLGGWYYIADLNGDNVPEVILFDTRDLEGGEHEEYVVAVSVLDGEGHIQRLGGLRLGTRLKSEVGIVEIPPVDLDGDGLKEIVMSVGRDPATNMLSQGVLFIDPALFTVAFRGSVCVVGGLAGEHGGDGPLRRSVRQVVRSGRSRLRKVEYKLAGWR